jgi:YD repeat-containing protein
VVFAGRPIYAAQLEMSTRPLGIVGDQLSYDAVDRIVAQTLPTEATRTYSYGALERTTQEPDLAPVHSVLDGQGRVIRTERSLSDGTHEIVEARYDAASRLTRMWLAGGAVERLFHYDTLGRLVESRDPDLGTRTLTWDDGDRLSSEINGAGQKITYGYDVLGRLISREGGDLFRFHYDLARPGAPSSATNLVGQLAWVEEPTGYSDVGYDALGRTVFSRREIDGRASEVTTTFAPSGLMNSRAYEDGFTLSYSYDPAGRLVGVGDLWQLVDQDAGGQPLHERTRNGVETLYQRDVLTLPSKVTLRDATGQAIYEVEATRNAWNALTGVTDVDGTGLDHSSQFGYDGFARLTSATVGRGLDAFTFAYTYDVLHNMTMRTATGPRVIGAFFGAYHYGEAGQAPRQLSSIVDPSGTTLHTFGYDAAGRQTMMASE